MKKNNSDKKIKIIQFISSLSTGGAETLVKDYAILSSSLIETVVVVKNRRNGKTANELQLENYNKRIISLEDKFGLNNKFKLIYYKFNPEKRENKIKEMFFNVITKENPNVIHVHLSLLKYLEPYIKYLKDNNIKVLYTCHNLPHLFFSGNRKKEGEVAKKMLEANILQIIALHDDMKNEINDMFNIKSTIALNNGVDFKRFQLEKFDKQKKLGDLNIPKNTYVVGHIGRFSYQKNHEFLIDIFSEICKKKKNAFLLLIGSGKEKENIIKKLHDLNLDNKYLILENRSDIPELLNVMDVFVFPSRFEGFGNVLIEAQVSNLRCIVSDNVPSDVLLTNHIIPIKLKESPSKWCEISIDSKIKNNNIYGNLNDYDMNKIIKELEQIYRS